MHPQLHNTNPLSVQGKENNESDVWVMDFDGNWTCVPDGADLESLILCAPVHKPRHLVADSEEAAAQAPACPIEEEVPKNDDEDE